MRIVSSHTRYHFQRIGSFHWVIIQPLLISFSLFTINETHGITTLVGKMTETLPPSPKMLSFGLPKIECNQIRWQSDNSVKMKKRYFTFGISLDKN
jgi:hypothetical protein